jgi:hypothetical protein
MKIRNLEIVSAVFAIAMVVFTLADFFYTGLVCGLFAALFLCYDWHLFVKDVENEKY